MRDPTSAYSFVAYLHDCGRLVDFMNRKTLFPLRIEFHDYLVGFAPPATARRGEGAARRRGGQV
jgi:lysine/ornithine N-monooxygenase